mgnify:CR=1 FL=1
MARRATKSSTKRSTMKKEEEAKVTATTTTTEQPVAETEQTTMTEVTETTNANLEPKKASRRRRVKKSLPDLRTFLTEKLQEGGYGETVERGIVDTVVTLLAEYQIQSAFGPNPKKRTRRTGPKKYQPNTFVSYLLGKSPEPSYIERFEEILKKNPLVFQSDSTPSKSSMMQEGWKIASKKLKNKKFSTLSNWTDAFTKTLPDIPRLQRGNALTWFLNEDAKNELRSLVESINQANVADAEASTS